ncbi:MAG: ABC transporter ATP-binding protein [Chlamydiae bacterium]|nr:ABC transporter ATP-binding protein [Chlamydiota bacterium]MBI3265723.1 ABC transporter ATP-binding protein [Chlamydiota bacterium]
MSETIILNSIEKKLERPQISSPILCELIAVSKEYSLDSGNVMALKDIHFRLYEKDFLSILGPSGSGKSTLLHILGLLSNPSKGRIFFKGQDVSCLSEWALARLRGQKIGFVFQAFHLLPSLNALENVALPLIYQRVSGGQRKRKALEALEKVGLARRSHHFPRQLSGGESQRVAIARALVSQPSLILADEPTGNLDTQMGKEILGMLKMLNEEGKTVVVVTHDVRIANEANRILFLKDGKVESLSSRGEAR